MSRVVRPPNRERPGAESDVPSSFLGSLTRGIVRLYASADPRSLGLFRIALGTLLFVDVARRLPDVPYFYSNSGFLTNHLALYRPMSSHLFSLYHAFDSPLSVYVMMTFHLAVNFALLVGWRTRGSHVIAAVLITSLNSRSVMLENGGWVVLNLLTIWTMFLPLGERFSVDAFRKSWRTWRESTLDALADRRCPERRTAPVVSLAVTALIAQWVVIYAFNVVHKTGPAWRDGTAVYYFFEQDRMVTAAGGWVREIIPLSMIKVMTWSTLFIESCIAALLLMPWWSHRARLVALLLAVALHGTIDVVVQLGPFSWAIMVMFVALLAPEHWSWTARRLRNRLDARRLVVDPKCGLSLTIARVVKRLDVLGLVEFAAPMAASDATDQAGARADDAKSILVVESNGGDRWTGALAVARLSDALPIPGFVVAPLAWPPFHGMLDRLSTRAWRRRHEWSRALGVVDLRGEQAAPRVDSRAREQVLRARRHLGTACVVLLLVATGSQVLVENRAVPDVLKPSKRPEWMVAVVVYPRLFQGWSMFAPAPPNEDGRVVVDGRTADGRHFDPFTKQKPSWDVQPRGGFGMNQIWGDFHRRIPEGRFRHYLPGVRDMLRTIHTIDDRPEDALVAFDVWYVGERVPPPGQPRAAPTRRKLISYGVVRDPKAFPDPPRR